MTREDHGQTKQKKERTMDENEWAKKKIIRKRLTNCGQAYTTSRRKQVGARKMAEGFKEDSRQKCHATFGLKIDHLALHGQFIV